MMTVVYFIDKSYFSMFSVNISYRNVFLSSFCDNSDIEITFTLSKYE